MKAQMSMGSLLIGLLVFSAVLVGISTFIGGLESSYSVEIGNYTSYSKDEETIELISNMANATITGEATFTDQAVATLKGVWAAITMPLKAMNIFSNMTAEVSPVLLLPVWTSRFIYSFFGLIFVLSLIGLVMNRGV